MNRCVWAKSPIMVEYHDKEWGVPVRNDRKMFEFLVLESFQAGLSWEIVLRKRENFRKAFHNFDAERIAKYTGKDVRRLMNDAGIIRNRQKILAAINNARRFLEVKREHGSFSGYLWSFVNHKPVKNKFRSLSQLPAKTAAAEAMSNALKEKGFRFVGATVCYAHMQAVGMVNDHVTSCFRYNQV